MMISIKDHASSDLKKFEDFVSLTAHELKTPVSVLKAYLQITMRQLHQSNEHTCVKTLERMDVQLNRLLHLISDLQDGMMAKSEELHCLMNALPVNDVLLLCAEDASTTYPELQVELSLADSQPLITADKERIEQVLHNLITNAVKYSGDQKHIRIASEVKENMVVISVTDKGFGIQEIQQAYIFDQFYRVKSSVGKQQNGLGLGLYICAEIIRKHEGKIWVTSKEGMGSEFSFSLPLKVI